MPVHYWYMFHACLIAWWVRNWTDYDPFCGHHSIWLFRPMKESIHVWLWTSTERQPARYESSLCNMLFSFRSLREHVKWAGHETGNPLDDWKWNNNCKLQLTVAASAKQSSSSLAKGIAPTFKVRNIIICYLFIITSSGDTISSDQGCWWSISRSQVLSICWIRATSDEMDAR